MHRDDRLKLVNRAIPFLYEAGLVLAVVAMPFSNLGMSVASFWIAGTWLIDQWASDRTTRHYRWSKALRNPLFWILTGLFIIHVIGLMYTRDFNYALRDIRIKLPLLLFPLFFFTARPIEGRTLRRMLLFFVISTSAAALYCLLIPLGLIEREVSNIRDISIFISHIRFSILLVFSSAILLLWLSRRQRIGLVIPLLLINLSFLWVIESLTGVVLLAAVLVLYLISVEASVLPKPLRRFLRVALPFALLVAGWQIKQLADAHFKIPEGYEEQLPIYTAHGSPYTHHLGSSLKENGHLIWYNIAPEELDTAWARRSDFALTGLDQRNHKLYNTLLRYMSSKGLNKDAEGVAQLTNQDIRNIEQGVTSVLEFEHRGLRRRVDKIFFEVSLLRNGGNPSGNSVTQRLEFWRAAWHIIRKKPLFGVGTGDVKTAMSDAYVEIDSRLYDAFRLRAHNQYLTFWVAFGIFGILLLLASLLLPLGVPVPERGFLFTTFCMIVALSYLTEDTLETQAGVTFIAFFAALFSAQRLAFHARIRPGTED